jgi:hypothetical protein
MLFATTQGLVFASLAKKLQHYYVLTEWGLTADRLAGIVLVMLILLVGLLRMRPWAWWGTLLLLTSGMTLTVVAFFPLIHHVFLAYFLIVATYTGLGLILHLLYIRKYYGRTVNSGQQGA